MSLTRRAVTAGTLNVALDAPGDAGGIRREPEDPPCDLNHCFHGSDSHSPKHASGQRTQGVVPRSRESFT